MRTVRVLSEYQEILASVPTLILKISMDGRGEDGRGLNVYIPLAAIENRKAIYGLETDDDAIMAILKEHATRELGLPQHDHPEPRIAQMGGLRKDVIIERS